MKRLLNCSNKGVMSYVTLSWPEFLQEAKEFCEKAELLGDHWQLQNHSDELGKTILQYKQKISINIGGLPEPELIQIEYHIAYSISYQVPMLFFRAQRQDGSLLDLDDAWNIFHDHEEGQAPTRSRADMLSILTQMDHPVQNRPYLVLHPCRTAELLGQAGCSKNRILTFISLMGPFVHLNLCNEYGLETSSKSLES